MSDATLIRGGTLVLAAGERRGDLLLHGGRVAALGPDLAGEGSLRVVDARGCLVLPGLVDPHTHIQLDTGIYRTPDNWEIGTRTAACGGVTTVIDFATQFPGQDVAAALAARLAEIGDLAQIDFGLHMMLTELPDDKVLDGWMAWLVAAGLPSIKLYTTYRPNYYQDDAALFRAFRAAAAHGLTVMLHCENDALVERGHRRFGRERADRIGQPRARSTGAGRDRSRTPGALPGRGSGQTDLPCSCGGACPEKHSSFAHAARGGRHERWGAGVRPSPVRCPLLGPCGTVDQVSASRSDGQPAIAETTPQYLLLDESMYAGPHPEWAIMQPPLARARRESGPMGAPRRRANPDRWHGSLRLYDCREMPLPALQRDTRRHPRAGDDAAPAGHLWHRPGPPDLAAPG